MRKRETRQKEEKYKSDIIIIINKLSFESRNKTNAPIMKELNLVS